jgi:hypothetical protein
MPNKLKLGCLPMRIRVLFLTLCSLVYLTTISGFTAYRRITCRHSRLSQLNAKDDGKGSPKKKSTMFDRVVDDFVGDEMLSSNDYNSTIISLEIHKSCLFYNRQAIWCG